MKGILLLFVAVCVFVVSAQDGTLTSTVQLNNIDRPLWETSPQLYGLMYEEIGHQGAGGLHTEMLDGGFFQQTSITPWTVQAMGGGAATECNMTLDSSLPHVNEILPRAMSLEAIGTHACGAVNPGYSAEMGAPVGRKFNVSLWIRTTTDADASLAVTIELWDSNNTVIGSVQFTGIGAYWHQFKAQIAPTLTKAVSPIKFVAIVPAGEHVWLHGVSLIPDQYWRGLPYIRADVGDRLAALKPATFRFPGGCFVEGDTMANAYRWKPAIGPYIERPGVYNGNWHYFSPNFLGPFELLNFAEQLNAAPIWVVNTGAAHGDYVDDYQLLDFIQDAVDAVEFAIGGADTYWGAKRAAMGHPAPFNPDTFFLGLGNEEDFNNLNKGGLPLYTKSYPKFYAAIKARFPNVHIVANNATVIVGGLEATDQWAELHDYNPAEHYIIMREEMWQDWRPARYMYVSEYGASCSTGAKYCYAPWSAAIAEAAFLLGMERYSNYVRSSCSETIGGQAVFNSLQTYGSPQYWTKFILAVEQGTHVIDTQAFATSGWEMYMSALGVTRKNADTGAMELVFKVVNWGNFSYAITVEGNNFPAGYQLGNVATAWWTMNGTTPTATNTYAHPDDVSARLRENVALEVVTPGSSFKMTVPYASITTMVIPLVSTTEASITPAPSSGFRVRHRKH